MIFVTLPVSLILKALHYRHADRDRDAAQLCRSGVCCHGHGNERYDARTGTADSQTLLNAAKRGMGAA